MRAKPNPLSGDRISAIARPPTRAAMSPERWSHPRETIRTGMGARRYSTAASGVALTITAVRRADTRPAPMPVATKFIVSLSRCSLAGLGVSAPTDPAGFHRWVMKRHSLRPHPEEQRSSVSKEAPENSGTAILVLRDAAHGGSSG